MTYWAKALRVENDDGDRTLQIESYDPDEPDNVRIEMRVDGNIGTMYVDRVRFRDEVLALLGDRLEA